MLWSAFLDFMPTSVYTYSWYLTTICSFQVFWLSPLCLCRQGIISCKHLISNGQRATVIGSFTSSLHFSVENVEDIQVSL